MVHPISSPPLTDERAPQKLADKYNASERLEKDPTAKGLSVDEFIEKILGQCRDVYHRHDKMTKEDYLMDGTYRTLEMEMVEVKVCT